MEIIKIDETEIFLDDKGSGQGKITISNTYGYNFSYYWGSMGDSLREFLLRINESYFITKLANNPYSFSPKLTAKEIRKYISEELSYDLPWYKYMEFQKSFREWIKGIEEIESDQEFVDYCHNILRSWKLDFSSLDRHEEKEVKDILQNSFTQEPWNFIQQGYSNEAIFLKKLFKKLQKELKEAQQ